MDNLGHKRGLKSKLGYASGDILGGGAFSLISLIFLAYLVKFENMPAQLAGTIVLIGKIWDAVTDPMMGIISDRTKSKFGRRRIYFFMGVLPIIITFSLMWYSFGIESTGAKFAYYTVMYMLFSTAFTMVMVPYNALLPDMIGEYKDRADYSTIRMLVSSVATLISVTVPNVILGVESARTPEKYLLMGIIFGCFYGLPLIFTGLSTWENPITDEQKPDSLGQQFRNFKTSFRNKSFRQYLGIFVCGQMATDVCTTILAFWLLDILQRENMLSLVSGVTMVFAVVVLPFNYWIATKFGKHLPGVIDQPFRVVALAIAFFMGPKTGIPLIIIVSIFNGIGGSASSFVPWTLLPDLPDSDEMITGKRSAGTYAGISTFVRKFTSGFGIFIVSGLLGVFGYQESASGETVVQTATALMSVRVLFSILPIVLTVITIILCLRYRLTKGRHALIKEAMDYKRENGVPTENAEQIAACEAVSGMKFEEMWVGQRKSA